MDAGIIISTHGMPAFVHLQLESVRRFSPRLPVLVYDDCSPQGDVLSYLANLYGARFESAPRRYGHYLGDMRAYSVGLKWGMSRGFDYIIKISRRFIVVQNWLNEFKSIAEHAPATIAMGSDTVGWYLRTSWIAMRIEDWCIHIPTIDRYANSGDLICVEYCLGDLSKQFGHFTVFPFLDNTKAEGRDNGNFLWYDFANGERYYRQSREWGLNYLVDSFNASANLDTT